MLDASSPPEVEAEPAETEELEEAGSEMDGSSVVYRISAVPWTTSLAGAAVTAVAVAKLAAVVKAGPDLRRVKKLRGLLLTKYESVIDTAEELKWTPLGPEDEEANDWHVTWIDTSVSFERIKKMGRLQKINHFPGASPATHARAPARPCTHAPARPRARAPRAPAHLCAHAYARARGVDGLCAACFWQACSISCASRARRAT